MNITSVNVARVSNNLRSFNLLRTTQGSQLSLFRLQNQLATGLRFQALSDDVAAGGAVQRIDRRLDVIDQVQTNLRAANATLTAADTAMSEAVDLVREAHSLALEGASDGTTPDERAAIATTIDSLLERLVAVGNREHLGTFLFSGRDGAVPPFELSDGGVIFRGDEGRLQTILDTDLSQHSFTISGQEFFNAVAAGVNGSVDLNPALTADTRLSDLSGATDTGIGLGRIRVSDGSTSSEIDLAGAATIGDVIDRLNDGLPATLRATISNSAVRIGPSGSGPVSITVADVAGGTTAVQLGIYQDTGTSLLVGADLDPRLTPRTTLAALLAGTGADLSAGLQITNGAEIANIDFTGATTLEDVLNRINQSDVGVRAEIADDGRTLRLVNLQSGSDMRVSGDAAVALGLRSLHAGIPLADLNGGLGVDSVEGDDLRITTADGTVVDVDVDDIDLATASVQDLLDLLNTAGGGAFSASLSATGGVTLTDNTTGAGTLTVDKLNLSPTRDSLGLGAPAVSGVINGQDVNPVEVDSPFTALIALRDALQQDDAQSVSLAGANLQESLEHLQAVHGKLAAVAQTMVQREERVEGERTAAEILRSDLRDVDLTEAIVQFQQIQTALQASLNSASQILNLSLLDYLR